jgi:hypothetical protein
MRSLAKEGIAMLIIALLYICLAWLVLPAQAIALELAVADRLVDPRRRYPALINVPTGMDRTMLRVGMVGTATVISDGAGPIGILANILLWVTAYAFYL